MITGMKSRGFTLIELLVVIAIIGLLSSVVFASLNSARGKARDARRKADLTQISKALELYYDTHNGTYLVSGYGDGGGGQGWFNLDGSPNTVAKGLNDAGFLSAASIDDPQQKPGYMIYLCDNGQRYAVSATLENPTPADIAYIDTTCNGTGGNGTHTRYGKNYAVGN
ncbi:MAG: type II secretion system protein [bacterium]|nr:type II secretion system protein [bacterium]